MNTGEIPRQFNLFTGDLVDTRTAAQKRKARLATLPKQQEMFSPHLTVYQRVNPHPTIPLPPGAVLPYEWTDPRTPEEIEEDIQREANKRTVPMFPEKSGSPPPYSPMFLLPSGAPEFLLPARSMVTQPTTPTSPPHTLYSE